MKKKVLTLLIVMTLVFAYAVPVAAAETDAVVTEIPAAKNIVDSVAPNADADGPVVPNGTEAGAVSEDPAVQAAYDAYVNMMESYSVNEYGPMSDAFEQLDKITGEFTEAQEEELTRVVEEYIGYEAFLEGVFSVAYVAYAVECQQAYKATPNAKTAVDFVDAYDLCVEAEITIDLFDPDIAADYEAAKAAMPNENVMKVYHAYDELSLELEFAWWGEDFIATCEDFEAVLDIFNELTEAELDQLAELMGVEDGEAAWNKIFSDWINANLVLQIGEPYDAFLANQSAETAKAYVEAYESVANDTQVLTQEDKDVILAFFADGSYELAKGYLTDEQGTTGTDESAATEGSDKSDKDTSPATGDDFNAAPYAALMVIAAGTAAVALRRKKYSSL